jgi:hypothetical protein
MSGAASSAGAVASSERGAWTCRVCGFRGFWAGTHCHGQPARPARYRHAENMGPGTLEVQQLPCGLWTVARVVGVERWFPLTAYENPAWLRWPRSAGAETFVANSCRCFDLDWPHWGSA